MNEISSFAHQIFIVDGLELPDSIPRLVEENIASVRNVYPKCEHIIWSGLKIRDFIKDKYGENVLRIFDIIKPYAYKADLARYCILHHFGGIYVDLGIMVINPILPPPYAGLASFRDVDFGSPCWTAVANGLIWAKPGRDEFEIAIKLIVENCTRKFYGTNWLYPTGPVLFGRALIAAKAGKGMSDDSDDQWIGSFRAITPGAQPQNLAFITPSNNIAGISTKKLGADISHLGISGANNYADIWKMRQIYSENVQTWYFYDKEIRIVPEASRESDAIHINPQYTGLITFGPYVPVDPGEYIFWVFFDHSTSVTDFGQDVAHNHGEVITAKNHLNHCANKHEISMSFIIENRVENLELRIYSLQPTTCKILKICLEKI